MTAQASLSVQFTPFRLSLLRDNDGAWHIALRRSADEANAAPLVISEFPGTPVVAIGAGVPKLYHGSAIFAVPTKQLRRINEWLDGLNKDVVGTTQGSEGSRDGVELAP